MFRILYVDDEPDLLELGKVFLESTAGFTVDTLTSARDALAAIPQKQYDTIVSDYQMPEMDGIAFLKAVRSSGNTIPFILFTGRGREEIIIQALNEGADFYIQKGGDPKAQFAELAHKIRQAVHRRMAEKELLKTSTMLETLLDAIPDVIGVQDPNHGMIRYNAAGYAMLGQTPEGVAGKKCFEMIGHTTPCDICATSEAYRTKRPAKVEKFVPELGVWLDVRSYPILDESGEIRFVIEHLRDITDQKRAHDELRASYEQITASEEELRSQFEQLIATQDELKQQQEQLTEVADMLPGVVYQFYARDDGTRGVNYVSRRAGIVFGFTGGAGTFFPWFTAQVDEQDRQAFLSSIDEAIRTATPWNFEGWFVKPSGDRIWFQGMSRPVRHGNELVFNGILLDSTDHKRAS